MEVVRILGGIAVIAVVVAFLALTKEDGGAAASAGRPAERSFASGESAARFVAPPGD